MTEHWKAPEPGIRPESAERFTPLFPRKPHVLIAEDDGELRCLLADALIESGFAVSQCSDGSRLFISTADSILDRTKPKVDLIISDVRMPGYTGIEFLSKLNDFRWNIPIILITAFGDPDTHERALRMGVFAILDKPFDIEKLVRTARHALAGVAFGRYFTDTMPGRTWKPREQRPTSSCIPLERRNRVIRPASRRPHRC